MLTVNHPRVTAAMLVAVGILLVGIATAADQPSIELNAGLALHLPLDGDCRDASGHDGDAVNHGASLVPDGKIGGAVAFDGRNGYLAIPAAATRGLKQFTLALWLKTRQAVAAPRDQFWKNPTVLGAASSGPGSADLAIVVEEGKPGYHHGLEPGQDAWLFSDRTIHDGQWHQVALTRNGSDVRLFLDGQMAFVDTGPAGGNVVEEGVSAPGADQALGGEGFFVGACNNTADAGPAEHFFQGSVDDVRIWSRALSAAEIAALWTANTGQTVPVPKPVMTQPSRAEAPVEAALDLNNSHGLSWRIEKRAGAWTLGTAALNGKPVDAPMNLGVIGLRNVATRRTYWLAASQADQLDSRAARLSGSTQVSDVTFRFSLDLALRDDSPAAALTAHWSVDRDLPGFEVCVAYHSVGTQDWRCTVYPFAGNSEAVDLAPLNYVGVPSVLMFRPDLSLVTLLGIDPASDYLNPNTWTGTTGFCFRNHALPAQYRAGGGKLTAGIEYSLPLQVFLSDAGTSPAAVSRLVQDWIKVNRYQVEPMSSIRTPAEALALYLKGRRSTNMWKPGQGYQLQDAWPAIYVPVSPQSAYFEYLLYEQTGDELWRKRCFEQLDFVLTAQLREPGPLCGYIHTCYLLNEKQFNSDDRGSNPGYKVDMNLHTARYLLLTWQHVKQREGIDRQDWYQAAVQAVDWALAQRNPDGGLPQKLDYGTLRHSISVCSGRALAALPVIARITGDAKYMKALDGLEQFLRRNIEDRYWFTGQHPDLYPGDFESDSIWCSCEYWLDKYDRTQDAECLARAKANAHFAFLMLCPKQLSWVRNPTQTCHAEQLHYLQYSNYAYHNRKLFCLRRLGELTGEPLFSQLFERIMQCGFWAQVTEGNYCGAQHERMADPWKKVSREVDSKGTLYLNELSLDANLQLLEMGVMQAGVNQLQRD